MLKVCRLARAENGVHLDFFRQIGLERSVDKYIIIYYIYMYIYICIYICMYIYMYIAIDIDVFMGKMPTT